MGLRKAKRQIAKARLTAMGVGNVNRKMSRRKEDGVPNWRKAIEGKTGEDAHRIQMNYGKLKKARRVNRKIEKVN